MGPHARSLTPVPKSGKRARLFARLFRKPQGRPDVLAPSAFGFMRGTVLTHGDAESHPGTPVVDVQL